MCCLHVNSAYKLMFQNLSEKCDTNCVKFSDATLAEVITMLLIVGEFGMHNNYITLILSSFPCEQNLTEKFSVALLTSYYKLIQ